MNFGWEAILILAVLVVVWNVSHPTDPEVVWERICGCQKISEDAPTISFPVNVEDVRYRVYGVWPFGIKDQSHPKYGHSGIDFELRREAEILAAAPGTVVAVGKNPRWPGEYWVRIDCGSTIWSLKYDHLGKVFVESRNKVKRGQVIGRTAIRNDNPVSMIHFEVDFKEKIYKGIYNRIAVCPGPYFSKQDREKLISMVLRSKYHRLCYAERGKATK